MENLKLPVGIENFEEIRTKGFYYVDKTELIRDLLNSWGKVNLFTRPRRAVRERAVLERAVLERRESAEKAVPRAPEASIARSRSRAGFLDSAAGFRFFTEEDRRGF